MLEKVKTVLRINHNRLDNDILETISASRAEMVRAGVLPDVANGNSDLVEMAIKTYCLYVYQGEKYFEAWSYQLDCLRKSENV